MWLPNRTNGSSLRSSAQISPPFVITAGVDMRSSTQVAEHTVATVFIAFDSPSLDSQSQPSASQQDLCRCDADLLRSICGWFLFNLKNMQKSTVMKFKPFNAAKYRVAVVVAQFNRDITEPMLRRAVAAAKKYRLPRQQVRVYRVHGSVEIPVVLKALAESEKYDCVVAIGCIIRGETDHYEYVAQIVTQGVLEVMEEGMPVGFGVLTVNSKDQAIARIASGATAMEAALQTAKIVVQIKRGKK